ncbi:hypothetical protein SCATT_01610 [Streptantibioticus cattleyicolor NRRL 8057 = DSM 46488]|uniref:Uncharacterized protein n=1 Tax=Streptantibioticus cattleyicolor (strain ATCC 35852 / DSM 46488 / JCM 4925 / NBRC 14057 / NRRL 8057) TaxID=1003195 RepID=G8X1K3_STREN|nr:hypothetical protein SCATT_01610 [Streptantibioticus cattleyicolor NRRL 8057 = DSM 46488]
MGRWRGDGVDAQRIVSSAAGAYVRGFDHEAPVSPCGNDDKALRRGRRVHAGRG